MGDIVRKHQIALFVDTDETGSSPAFKRIKKSTTLTISANPVLEDYDYISDVNPSSELVNYAPSIDQDIVMIKGEDDYNFAFSKFYNLETGDKAHVDAMIIFMQESTADNSATPTVTGTGITAAEVLSTTFATKVNNLPGTYVFTYDGTNWKLSGSTVVLTDYGITTTGTAALNDSISVVYTVVNHYKAWKFNSIMSSNDLNAIDRKINVNFKFSGDITKGVAVITAGVPVFTAS